MTGARSPTQCGTSYWKIQSTTKSFPSYFDATVDYIYELISDCQQLYPDSELSSDSAEENADGIEADGYFTTADGLQHLSLEGEATLSHLENIIVQNHSLSMEDG